VGVAVEPVELYGVAADGVYAGGLHWRGVRWARRTVGLGFGLAGFAASTLRSSTQVGTDRRKRSHAKLQALLWPSIQSISMPLPSVMQHAELLGVC